MESDPIECAAYDIRSWYNPSRYVNGVGAGLGLAIPLSPVTLSIDPTYNPQAKPSKK